MEEDTHAEDMLAEPPDFMVVVMEVIEEVMVVVTAATMATQVTDTVVTAVTMEEAGAAHTMVVGALGSDWASVSASATPTGMDMGMDPLILLITPHMAIHP